MKSNESVEDYLETILMLNSNGHPTRSIDIANELGFSRPSVSIAMKHLKSDGYVSIDIKGYITLTESGHEIAQSIYERHMLISDWLIFLGVDRETAVNDACRIEHGISEQSFLAFKQHFEDWKRSVYMQKVERDKYTNIQI